MGFRGIPQLYATNAQKSVILIWMRYIKSNPFRRFIYILYIWVWISVHPNRVMYVCGGQLYLWKEMQHINSVSSFAYLLSHHWIFYVYTYLDKWLIWLFFVLIYKIFLFSECARASKPIILPAVAEPFQWLKFNKEKVVYFLHVRHNISGNGFIYALG